MAENRESNLYLLQGAAHFRTGDLHQTNYYTLPVSDDNLFNKNIRMNIPILFTVSKYAFFYQRMLQVPFRSWLPPLSLFKVRQVL